MPASALPRVASWCMEPWPASWKDVKARCSPVLLVLISFPSLSHLEQLLPFIFFVRCQPNHPHDASFPSSTARSVADV
jgi:hypothetical protein